jgi:phosphoglycerate dehydrogenase-like enzyme
MKAVLHYRATPGFREQVSRVETEWLRVLVVEETERSAFAREMRDADVLLHVLEPVSSADIDAAPKLRLIQKLGVGVDTIDLDAARRRGVAVCNMPGTNTRAVAELTLLLMLASLRRLSVLDAQTRSGKGWCLQPESLDRLAELGGRTVGLVGYGAVGRCLAPMLRAIGATVLYTDASDAPDAPSERVRFEDLLPAADIVSLHLPLTPRTSGLMNAKAFAAMKPGAIFINTARGGLVDEAALIGALQSGHLRGAGLDVFMNEPVGATHPLLQMPNVVLTPHLAWFTAETLTRSLVVFAENCRRLRDGETLIHRVV